MTTFTLQAQVFYTDGTSGAVQTPLSATTDLAVGELVTYPSGFTQLGLDALEPTKTPDYYEVWLKNGNNQIITIKKRFYLRDPEHNEIDIWFQSSLGVIEAVNFRSGLTQGISVQKELFEQILPFNTDHTIHLVSSTESYLIEEYEASSGFHSKADLIPYTDMLISNRVWWISDGQRIPIVILPGSFSIVASSEFDGTYSYAINFKFKKAFNKNSFSNA